MGSEMCNKRQGVTSRVPVFLSFRGRRSPRFYGGRLSGAACLRGHVNVVGSRWRPLSALLLLSMQGLSALRLLSTLRLLSAQRLPAQPLLSTVWQLSSL